jgi:hypothetical protein
MATRSNKITDYYYLNTLIANTTDEVKRVEYETTQNLPILGEIQDFKMAVARMKVPLANVPIMLFEDNKYFMSLALPDGSDPGSIRDDLPRVELIYFPASNPINPTPGLEGLSPIYNYQHLIEMVNIALRDLWQTAFTNAAYTGPGGPLSLYPNPAIYPYFRYNCDLGCIELVCGLTTDDRAVFYPGQEDNGIKLLMSTKLYHLFHGYASYHHGSRGIPNLDNPTPPGEPPLTYSLWFYVENKDIVDLPTFTGHPTGPYSCSKQDFSSIHSFQQVTRVILTTTIALVRETILGEDNGGVPIKLEILTDLELEPNDGRIKENVYYNPSGDLRWHNFKDQGDFRRFDLKVFVQFVDGTIVPLTILPCDEVNVKLAFKRRKHQTLYQITDSDRATK